MTKAYSYIRFSTPEQLKGDSLRRQKEASEQYAKDNGLTLDTTLNMQDLGLSAFHGINRIKGALGRFLQHVESGTIEKGSVLIVENLDRLSREQVLDALNQFTSIIQSGIKIVTLQDNVEYSKESISDNWSQLIISITYMARANDESKRKSQRLSAAWNQKRIQATNGQAKLTARCPLWLRLSEDKTKYILIPEVCKCIEKIYRLKLSGKSKYSITTELNQMDIWKPPVTTRNKTGGWREDYIQKILTTPAVIGTFQPCKRVEDKKVPTGAPILGYFPAAIDKLLFYEVQDLIKRNKEQNDNGGNGGGNTGKANNLFVHTVICGICKHPMHHLSKGRYSYLHCDYSRRKLDCDAKPIRYDEFERLIFSNFEELNISDLLPDSDEIQIQLNDINRRLTAHRYELNELDSGIENISDIVFTTKDARVREGLEKRLSDTYDKKEQISKEIKYLTKESLNLQTEAQEMQKNIDTAKELYSFLQSAKDEQERISMRLKLSAEIRKLVKSIEIYPLQEDYKPFEEIEPEVYQFMNSKHIDYIRIRFNEGRKKRLLYLKTVAASF